MKRNIFKVAVLWGSLSCLLILSPAITRFSRFLAKAKQNPLVVGCLSLLSGRILYSGLPSNWRNNFTNHFHRSRFPHMPVSSNGVENNLHVFLEPQMDSYASVEEWLQLEGCKHQVFGAAGINFCPIFPKQTTLSAIEDTECANVKTQVIFPLQYPIKSRGDWASCWANISALANDLVVRKSDIVYIEGLGQKYLAPGRSSLSFKGLHDLGLELGFSAVTVTPENEGFVQNAIFTMESKSSDGTNALVHFYRSYQENARLKQLYLDRYIPGLKQALATANKQELYVMLPTTPPAAMFAGHSISYDMIAVKAIYEHGRLKLYAFNPRQSEQINALEYSSYGVTTLQHCLLMKRCYQKELIDLINNFLLPVFEG